MVVFVGGKGPEGSWWSRLSVCTSCVHPCDSLSLKVYSRRDCSVSEKADIQHVTGVSAMVERAAFMSRLQTVGGSDWSVV